jgi:uncharacterized protein (DUF2147 family)
MSGWRWWQAIDAKFPSYKFASYACLCTPKPQAWDQREIAALKTLAEVTVRAGALAVLALAGVAGAAPVGPEGLWNTPEHHGVVEVYDCDGAICARIVTSDTLRRDPTEMDAKNKDPALRDRLLKGLTVMSDFKGGPTEWKNGRAYDPDDGGTYHGSMKMVGADVIRLTGCIVFPLCRTDTWTRVH